VAISVVPFIFLTFVRLLGTHCTQDSFFYYTKALLRCDANTETVHRQLLQLVAIIRGGSRK